MATAMKRLGVYLGLVEDDQYDYAYHGNAQQPVQERSPSPSPVATLTRKEHHPEPEPRPTRMGPVSAPVAPVDPYAIHTIHPRSYNDARRIGEEYRAGAPVIMNLSDMNDVDAKRIVDFAAGLVFAMHGSIERVTQKVFLLSPANVDVRDAPAVQQARDGFFNQS